MGQDNFSSTLTTNINFLATHRFCMKLGRNPNVAYFCQEINLPGMSLGTATQATPFVDIPRTGDKIQYEDLVMTFSVDENMANYKEIANWMVGMGFPRNYPQFAALESSAAGIYSNLTLFILDSNENVQHTATFNNAIPTALSGLGFSTKVTDAVPMQCTVNFRYAFWELDEVNVDPTQMTYTP